MDPRRFRTANDLLTYRPVHVVWEITLACNLKCRHCGSRAGKKRQGELTTEECLDVISQLESLGTREITLIGGEAYLRSDWLDIIRAIRHAGIDCTMQSGGRDLTAARIFEAADAGLQGVGISLDGLESTHDMLRGVQGSFSQAIAAIRAIVAAGLTASVNTQITSGVLDDLPRLFQVLVEEGVKNWQVQLTVAMGNAVDNSHLLLQPYQLAKLMPILAELHSIGIERGLLLQPGNNIGYFGPYEHLWRGNGDVGVHWIGCTAGKDSLGLEADGTVKACPSLATRDYAAGNVRDTPIATLWNEHAKLAFTREDRTAELWGFCRTCYYAQVCQGGCTWTAHSLLGRPGNNPYCHHRVLTLMQIGKQERIIKVRDAAGLPFDTGGFEVVEESIL